MNKLLAICITTYQRDEILNDCLSKIVSIAKINSIGIYVNDNSSNDNTNKILQKFKDEYEFFFPKINSENIGFDRNFEDCLKRADAEYVWGMGDYSLINEDSIEKILSIIYKNKFDAIFLNNNNRIKNIPTKKYIAPEHIFEEIGWHITLLDSIVWSKQLITKAPFKRYYNSLFGYYGALFDYLTTTSCNTIWINESLIDKTHPKKSSLWMPKAIDTWCEKWSTTVLSLPFSVTLETKIKLIQKHNKKSNLFTLRSFIRMRSMNYLNFTYLQKYRYAISISLPLYSRAFMILISATPVIILSILNKIYKYYNASRFK